MPFTLFQFDKKKKTCVKSKEWHGFSIIKDTSIHVSVFMKKKSILEINIHKHHYVRPRTKTDKLQYSFLPNTIMDWNSLPGKTINTALESQDPVKSFAEIVRGEFCP
jgi:non-homologous end joining protein Ku